MNNLFKNKYISLFAFMSLAVLLSVLSFSVYSSIEKQEIAKFESERRNRISTASSFFGARLSNIHSQLEFMEEVFVPPGDGKIDEAELRKIFARLVLVAPSAILAALDTGKNEDMLVVTKNDVETSEAMNLLSAKIEKLRRGDKHGISFSATPEHQYMVSAVELKGREGCLVAIMDIGEALKMSLVFAGNQPFSLLATDGRLLYSSNFIDQIGKNVHESSAPQLKLFADVLPTIPDDFGVKQTLEVQFHPTDKYGLDGFVLWSNVLTKAENDLVLIAYRPTSLVAASLAMLRNWILLLTVVFLVIPGIFLARGYIKKSGEARHSREVLELFTQVTGDSYWEYDLRNGNVFMSANALDMLGETNPVRMDNVQKYVHPEDKQIFLHEIGRVFKKERSSVSFECRFKAVDGGYKWLWERGRVINNMLVGVGTNIEEHKKREHTLENLSAVDALTKIWNRRYLERRMEEETARIERAGGTACVCLGDVGEFKKVNDNFGHDVGDEVLKAIAQAMSSHIRETDVAARLGGDEFVLMFSNIDEEEVQKTIERIKKSLEETQIFGTAADGTKEKIKILIDFGIKFYPDGKSKSLIEAMKLADEDMYERKQARKRENNIPPR